MFFFYHEFHDSKPGWPWKASCHGQGHVKGNNFFKSLFRKKNKYRTIENIHGMIYLTEACEENANASWYGTTEEFLGTACI